MRRRTLILPAVLLLVAGVAHARQKKVQVPPQFQNAHTIYVECVDGDGMKPGVSEADKAAVMQVQMALREWNRYSLADSPEKADLIIVVRKGRGIGDQDHIGLGPHPQMPQPGVMTPGMQPQLQAEPRDQNASVGTGGDTIATEDMLRVYILNQKGKLKGPIWTGEMDKGLDGPTVHLVRQLQAAVDITYPRQDTAQTAPQPAP